MGYGDIHTITWGMSIPVLDVEKKSGLMVKC